MQTNKWLNIYLQINNYIQCEFNAGNTNKIVIF